MKLTAIITVLLLQLLVPSAHAEARGEHLVGTDWVWFTDYAYWSAEWALNAESGCVLEAGVGMKVGGKPRGGIQRFKTYYRFTTYGIGAIHVRAVAGEAPCLVKLSMGEVSAVPVYGDPSVMKGAIHDGKIIYEKGKEAAKDAVR